MKENIKLAIFDIDGTLIPRGQNHINDETLAALEKLRATGIEIMVATGRASYFIQKDVFNRLKPDYVVTINGAAALNENNEIFYEVRMDLDEVNRIIEYCRTNDIGLASKLANDMHVYHQMDTYVNKYLHGHPDKHILKDHTQDPLLSNHQEIPLGLFAMGDETQIAAMAPDYKDSYFSHAYEGAYDIFSKRAGKIKGIEAVLEKLGLTWDNVISFGDADNDISMIQHAAIGVAMGNAIESLKKKADFVTKDSKEDGIEYALKHFNLID